MPRPKRLSSLVVGLSLGLLLAFAGPADSASARTRSFCSGFVTRTCGGHLQPTCTSGSACNAGHSTYTGSPFPITIDCPWPIPDVKVKTGCFDRRPDCGDCSSAGQIPCPPEAEPWCTEGCDNGLAPDPITGLCEVPSAPGDACGPLAPCPAGLTCDPFAGFVCVAEADAGESCASPFVHCKDDLQCTLALECSHTPARQGETCDATAHCGEALFCQPGLPQRCQAYRKPGEGCSVVNPCMPGSSCEPCFTSKCQAPLQCFVNRNNGVITEQQCRSFYSPGDSQMAQDLGLTLTYASGAEIAGITGASFAVGFAYGQDGRYGCFDTLCTGLNLDASIEAFVSVGLYETYDDVAGSSFATFQEAQVPGNLLNFATSQVFQRFGAFPEELIVGGLIGTEDALAAGIGPNPFPFAAGAYACETRLDDMIATPPPGGGPGVLPPPAAPLSSPVENAHFDFDLSGWLCTGGGSCAWVEDDPEASTVSGAGEVTGAAGGAVGALESSCVAVTEGQSYGFSAWLKASGARDGSVVAAWYAAADCTGSILRNDFFGDVPPDGSWREAMANLTAPPGARAVVVSALAEGDPATGTDGVTRLDIVYVSEPEQTLQAAAAGLLLAALAAHRRRRD